MDYCNLPTSSFVDVNKLSSIFRGSNVTNSYKFFWFKSILDYIAQGKKEISFNELIYQMVVNSWYMVTLYKLNLSYKDSLQELDNTINQRLDYYLSSKKSSDNLVDTNNRILDFLLNNKDKEIKDAVKGMGRYVPYLLQTPFYPDGLKRKLQNGSVNKEDIAVINQLKGIIYTFGEHGKTKTIIIEENWFNYFTTNAPIIDGWWKYKLTDFLQKRNPAIPGIIYKILPNYERGSLEHVRDFWSALIKKNIIKKDIYTGKSFNNSLTNDSISIDHFVPWTFVTHNEFWNLIPTLGSINSSKSDRLGDWDSYYRGFEEQLFIAYTAIYSGDAEIEYLFRKCQNNHLTDAAAINLFENPNLTEEKFKYGLRSIIEPVFMTAKNAGFVEWTCPQNLV